MQIKYFEQAFKNVDERREGGNAAHVRKVLADMGVFPPDKERALVRLRRTDELADIPEDVAPADLTLLPAHVIPKCLQQVGTRAARMTPLPRGHLMSRHPRTNASLFPRSPHQKIERIKGHKAAAAAAAAGEGGGSGEGGESDADAEGEAAGGDGESEGESVEGEGGGEGAEPRKERKLKGGRMVGLPQTFCTHSKWQAVLKGADEAAAAVKGAAAAKKEAAHKAAADKKAAQAAEKDAKAQAAGEKKAAAAAQKEARLAEKIQNKKTKVHRPLLLPAPAPVCNVASRVPAVLWLSARSSRRYALHSTSEGPMVRIPPAHAGGCASFGTQAQAARGGRRRRRSSAAHRRRHR